MEIRKGQKVRVTCTEARLKEVGVKQKHIKHILGKIGTVKEVRNIPDMEILAYFVHFPYVNLKAAPGNKKPYYVLLEDMIVNSFLRQQSIRDRKKQLERSRKRQQLTAANTDKSNNWRRLHGLCTRRKYKKHAKKN